MAAVAVAAIGVARRQLPKSEPSAVEHGGPEMEQRLVDILAGLRTQQLLSPGGAEPLSLGVLSLRGLLAAFNLAKHQGERRVHGGEQDEEAESEIGAQ